MSTGSRPDDEIAGLEDPQDGCMVLFYRDGGTVIGVEGDGEMWFDSVADAERVLAKLTRMFRIAKPPVDDVEGPS